ncbi:MAG: Flp pilus assembly complex ATPase component TadA [Candidatus Omnitrophica bacterium]|nr:Flp pilus assembly complex ATPase component TadA [Candidatus Omnitrophota bacterium]
MTVRTYLRLGEILVREGVLTEQQLRDAIGLQKTTGKRLGETLVSLKLVSEEQLADVLGRQLGIPFLRHAQGELQPADDPSLQRVFTADFVREQMVLPLYKKGKTVKVAMVDPMDLILLDNLKRMTGCEILPVITTRSDLLAAIETVHGKEDLLKKAVGRTYDKPAEDAPTGTVEVQELQESKETTEELASKAGEPPIVRLVDLFLLEAVNSRASDIHVEPQMSRISIRFRIDGVLMPVDPPAAHVLPAIVSRIKILAKMDIAEKRLPQDGGFTIRIGDKIVDLRVSTIPVIYGEKVVIRLLDKSALITDFKALGMQGRALQDTERCISAPYGLIFVTGPTGSGKSTTLYAILSRLKNSAKNITSIEDPVEYKVDGVNQVQAKPQIGLTFAAGLRAFLRQDPDILMVGEVRDRETAEICVRAALTGHLVLSTLHTNDAASAITRLVDIGIEPFLLSPSLVLLIAQRLVRRLCTECKEPVQPSGSLLERVQLPAGKYFRAKGCASCRNTGYKGRMAIYEVLSVDAKVQELISKRGTSREIKELARSQGMKTLVEDGVDKAAGGITSPEEVFSVTIGER